jgi:putative ABC transport system substrate-binding protein
MKKTACFLLLTIALFPPALSATPLEIGIVWMGESSMTERIEAAFIEEIQKMVPDVDIEKQHVADIRDFAGIETIVRRYEKEKDGIVLLRSNGAKWLSENRTRIPTFIGATNNPEAIGAVKNMDQPEGNVTGVTYYLPHEIQFQIFETLLPQMKSILILLQKGHASTEVDRSGTRAACKKRNIAYNEVAAETIEDSLRAVKSQKEKVSAIIIGTNNINLDQADKIIAAAGDTPVLAYTDKAVKLGALAGYTPNDQKRGKMLAESVYEVLVNKTPISQVPVKTDPDPRFLLNAKAAERYNIDIPYTILNAATIID